MNEWYKKAISTPLSKVTKGSWMTGKEGKYDGVPRKYLQAKSEKLLTPARKNPWEK